MSIALRHTMANVSGYDFSKYMGNLVVHLSALYGTASDSWTTVDDRYVFRKFNNTQSDLTWNKDKCEFRGENVGLYADVLPEDRVSTEMTIEVVIGNYEATSVDNGIVFALNSGYSLNSDIYGNCKGIRSAAGSILSSYYGIAQDNPKPIISSIEGIKTIAITNGSLTGTRIAYIIDGVLTPSGGYHSAYDGRKVPSMFGIGGTPNTSSGWGYGLMADIYAVRIHYGIIPVEQLMTNHLLDLKLYGK